MVKLVKSKIIYDLQVDTGVIVIDTDLQGAWEWGEQENFKYAFPNLYKAYVNTCLFDYKNKVGTCKLYNDSGYTFALLFTKDHRNDNKEVVIKNFNDCISSLFNLVSSDIFLYSPILGRNEKCFNELKKIIELNMKFSTEAPRNWFICIGD